MPLFEYACSSCGHQFEFLVQHGDTDPETCPQCGQHEPQKKLSSFAVSTGGAAPLPCGAPTSAGGCATGACPFSQP